MTARAPGKLVVSGAYAVLGGAPAVVTAVDRYATARGDIPASILTPEVQEAMHLLEEQGFGAVNSHTVPYIDASPLRHGERKLGLGSSAAIVVASIWEIILQIPKLGKKSSLTLRETVFETALAAHRKAQGGGSGIDVAASTYGGTLVTRLEGGEIYMEATPLPEDLIFEVWAMPQASSTAHFVGEVMGLSERNPEAYQATFGAQVQASLRAADALRKEDSEELLQALRRQHDCLTALGAAAGVPIVLPIVGEMHRSLGETGCFLPSGAGGGDVTLYIGRKDSSPDFRAWAEEEGLLHLDLSLDAAGSGPVMETGEDPVLA
jgi:phosphomevalonate kinase